ncbi:MAG: hypothetical protein KDA69_12545 [Planctomycetaceae bacterium]|nr:hypothetical protein [Planctomycetaceae bacterium]MCA9045147.1 hypothetical protein [Planctomycetaceae bacterium]
MTEEQTPKGETNDFASGQSEQELSFFAEFLLFLRDNKKWWLVPILVILGGLSALVVWATVTGAAPFIYSIF